MTWTVLETTYKNNRKQYRVLCDCGYIGLREARYVDSGRTTKCKSCSAKQTAKKYGMPPSFKGAGGLSHTHYSAISYGARRRGFVFNVTIEFLWGLFLSQNEKCALTGIPITLVPEIKNSNVNWDVTMCSLVVHHVNPEPSSLNGKLVSEKVQRLMGEEPTNNPDTSAQHPNAKNVGEDIV